MIVKNLPNLKKEIEIWAQKVFSTPSSHDCRKPLTYYSCGVKNTKQKILKSAEKNANSPKKAETTK